MAWERVRVVVAEKISKNTVGALNIDRATGGG